MKLKQLLGLVIAVLLCSTMAAAAGSQLTNVSVVAQGNSTNVTMRATGTFGHKEYKASEGLLLVDLTGVSAGKLHNRERSFQVPGVKSYRVVGYKGMGGTDIARLELRLTPGADAKVTETGGGVIITVTPAPGTAAPTTVAEETKPVATPGDAIAEKKPATPKPVQPTAQALGLTKVRELSVMRGIEGMEVEITATGPITATAMTLTSPSRIVLDIPNAVPAGRPRPIQVNSGDIRNVRIAQFQATPPVTRVVVDLVSAQDYEIKESGAKLVLKLYAPGVMAKRKSVPAVVPATGSTTPVQAASTPAMPKPEPTKQAALNSAAPVAPSAKPASSAPAQSDPSKALIASANSPIAKGDSERSAQAQPVVFVEPKYEAKAESNQAPQMMAANAVAPQSAAQQPAPATSGAPQRAVNFAAEQRQGVNEEVVQKPRYTGEPISVNLKDVDLKDFFRLIHEISGLNIVLDPSVSGTLTLVLDDVPWDQALDIVLKNNSLDRQLEGNVLRIATIDNLRKEAQARRLQAEAQALAVDKVNVTRFLSYAHAKDVMPTVKKLLSSRGDIIADERTNALVIQDIPNVIPEIDRLLMQLDRKTQEVEIDARVVAATRTFARDIGTQLGFGWGNGPSAIGGIRTAGDSPLIDNVPTNPMYFLNKERQIPLFSNLANPDATSGLSFLNATNNYRVDFLLSMAESRGLLKILSRPRVVTQNNIQALVKQGFRIPVVTQGQLGGPSSVTYIEAVLRLTVTPQITVENTIFLNVDIENTTPDFSREILGNPVFLTQQATTQVLVTNGGTVMIGGVIQTQNSVNVTQVPLLGNIPVLGNLFKRRAVENSTQELIFIITPKIVQT
ncbi:MAG TPA: type IV pilus secretin PilQ [Terriglobales bacterium]|nr:type IV pilus secretin PilQ [Terriglobales bacterium]